MSSELHRQLDQADFELRLRPTEAARRERERIIREMGEQFRKEIEIEQQSFALRDGALKLLGIEWKQAFPTGEESFRCTCGRLSRNGKYCGKCDCEL